jgi:L-ribulose-5-phosphate 4-epimerase
MAFEKLKEEVCTANRRLVDAGLVVLTWGNVSGVDREAGVMAIKPSGAPYASLGPEQIVVLGLDSGEVVEGDLNPSSDTPTHLVLYRAFPGVGGVVHTHSSFATAWAQAGRELPCFGTTHAGHFYGSVPVTRELMPDEVEGDYEGNTGKVIVERFESLGLRPDQVPGVLVARHAPFTWGPTVRAAFDNSVVLEEIARSGVSSVLLDPEIGPIPQHLLDKHFLRKHGPRSYYGQD